MSYSILELWVVNAFVFYAVAFVIGGAVADEYGSRHADYLDRMGLFWVNLSTKAGFTCQRIIRYCIILNGAISLTLTVSAWEWILTIEIAGTRLPLCPLRQAQSKVFGLCFFCYLICLFIIFTHLTLVSAEVACVAVTVCLAHHEPISWLNFTYTVLHGAEFTFAFVVLWAQAARLPIRHLRIRVHRTPVQVSVAELASEAILKFDPEWILHVMLVTEHLVVHTDPIMIWFAHKGGTHFTWVHYRFTLREVSAVRMCSANQRQQAKQINRHS